MVEVLLLGRPELLVNGREVHLATRKAMGLVAYLALQGPASRSTLAELLWGELGDEAARTNLRQELRRLRATPLGDCVATSGETVALLGPPVTDVARFLAELTAGRLEAALALYRGPLLEGFEARGAWGLEEWLVAERETLAARRREALAGRAAELEASGNPRGALGLHLELLREDELQERYHREAMRLHAVLGEREAALERFARLTHLLQDELGLAPLPETAELAERVRASGTAGPLPRPSAAPGVALHPPLVGREREWGRLEEGRGVVAVFGEPGVGKSRLAAEFVRSRGGALAMVATEDHLGIPFWSVAASLRHALGNPVRRARLEGLAPAWRREVARLVPEIDGGQGAEPAPAEGRALFLEALVRAFLALPGAGEPILVEDAHWLDAGSVEVFAQVARRLENPVIATIRAAEAHANPALERAVTALEREGRLSRLHLAPLSEGGVLSLVRALSGGAGGRLFARRLAGATGGNPLYILETLRHLFERGELRAEAGDWHTPYDEDTLDYRELPLPPGVREAVLERVDRLGAAARRLLEAASLAGSAFALDELTGATALSDFEALDALEAAQEAQLLERLEGDAGHRFAHDLVRRAVEAALGPERRRLLHRRLAAGLEASGGEPAQVARHLEGGGQPGLAWRWWARAGEAASGLYAHREALAHLERALLLAPDEAASAILDGRYKLRLALADWEGAGEELAAAAELLARRPDAALSARLAAAEADLEFRRGRFAAALQRAERVIAGAGPPEVRAWSLYIAGVALMNLGRPAEAAARCQAALETNSLAWPLGPYAENTLAQCLALIGRIEEARERNATAAAAFEKGGDAAGALNALRVAGLVASLAGDHVEAARLLERALARAAEIGHVMFERMTRRTLVGVLERAGELTAALRQAELGLELSRDPPDPSVEAAFLGDVGRLRTRLAAGLEAARSAAEGADAGGRA